MTNNYEEDKRCLQQELEIREHQLQREVSDKKSMEQCLNGAVTDLELKWEKECVSEKVRFRKVCVWLDSQFFLCGSVRHYASCPAGKKGKCCPAEDAKETQAKR